MNWKMGSLTCLGLGQNFRAVEGEHGIYSSGAKGKKAKANQSVDESNCCLVCIAE